MLEIAFETIKKVWNNDTNISLGLFVILVQLFMLVNPSFFFPAEKADHFRFVVLIYLVFLAISIALPDLRLRLFSVSLKKALPKALFFGAATYLVAFFIALFLVDAPFRGDLGFGVVFLDAFIIAVSEENMFRIVLPYFISNFASNSLFSLFHWQVYATNVLALFMMVLLGYVWTFIKERWSPQDGVANMGSHAGWNLVTRQFESSGVSA